MMCPPARSTRFPYTPLFRSLERAQQGRPTAGRDRRARRVEWLGVGQLEGAAGQPPQSAQVGAAAERPPEVVGDRKSTRLNSSHSSISYAVFCLKKKTRDPQP